MQSSLILSRSPKQITLNKARSKPNNDELATLLRSAKCVFPSELIAGKLKTWFT